jgi:hypothetical protein
MAKDKRPPSRGAKRPSFDEIGPRNKGAGKAGCLTAPAASRASEKSTRVIPPQVRPDQSGFPRAMVLTVSFELSLVIGLCCHHHRRDAKHHRQLDASVEASGPHDFAVRFPRASSWRAENVHRSPHLTFVTIAKRPSWRGAGRPD